MNTSPWNKNRIIGQKKAASDIPNLGDPHQTWLCSTWLWIVSFGAAIWLSLKYRMLHIAVLFQAKQRCCNRKPVALSNLRQPKGQEKQFGNPPIFSTGMLIALKIGLLVYR